MFRCAFPDCSYQMWDANFDDANAHWLTHAPAAPAAPALDPERLAKAMWAALSDQGTLRIDADEGKELADIAASVAVEYARLANPEKP